MPIKNLQLLSVILLAAMLLGCGYHLRSQSELPPQLNRLFICSNNPYGQFEQTLRHTLRSSGVVLVDSPQEAFITLSIESTKLYTATTNVGPTSQARTYNVTYTVIYSLRNSCGRVLLPPQTIVVSNTLLLNANQLLDSNNQLQMLELEMQRDAINQLYNQLSAERVAQL
jgi:LPS-assembly lipoprotein